MENLDKVGDVIAIGDGIFYRLYCYNVTSYYSYWILQVYEHHKFLWWKWEGWEEFEFSTNYGAGETIHHFITKRKDNPHEELVWQAELELDFLGIEYE